MARFAVMVIHEYRAYQLDLLHLAGLPWVLDRKIMDRLLISLPFLYHVDAIILVSTYNLNEFDNNSVWRTLCLWNYYFCRLHFVESKLFFKQPTSWRPRISRDLMISVASEMSRQALGSDGTQLPVQVIHEFSFVPFSLLILIFWR